VRTPSTTVRRYPAPNEVLEVKLGRGVDAIDIGFAGAVPDPATVTLGGSVKVERSGGNLVNGGLQWLSANVLRFQAEPAFGADEYVLTLSDTIASLPDPAGNVAPFDGEAGPAWPSGDNQPGGDLVVRFAVVP
jgi:hypothetical protein